MRHIVAIDGRDGSGKSYLAETLVRNADTPVTLLRVDDFRRAVDWDQQSDQGAAYYESYYDFAALDQLLLSFLGGAASGQTPIFDSVAETASATRTLDFGGPEQDLMLVIEGVMLRRLRALRDTQCATGVYIQTSEEEARRRILERDVAKGRTPSEVARRVDHRYFPAQRRYHREHAPESGALVVLEHERLARPRLLRCDLAQRPAAVRELLARVLPDSTD